MANYTIFDKTEQVVGAEQCPDADELSGRSSLFFFAFIFASTINIFLSCAVIVGNTLTVWALRGANSIHPSSRTLFYSLAGSDLCVGFVVQPFNIIHLVTSVTGDSAVCLRTLPYLNVIGFALCGISLLTTSEISVDRLLALRLKFRYRFVITLNRARFVVLLTWLASFAAGLTSLWSKATFTILQIIGVFTCIALSSTSYIWIHVMLRQRNIQRRERQLAWELPSFSATNSSGFNSVKYKKTVSTALWVYCTLLLCSMPYMVVAALWAVFGGSEAILICHAFTLNLLYFNSALNPLLYCWKIRDVRRGVKDILSRLSCSPSHQNFSRFLINGISALSCPS